MFVLSLSPFRLHSYTHPEQKALWRAGGQPRGQGHRPSSRLPAHKRWVGIQTVNQNQNQKTYHSLLRVAGCNFRCACPQASPTETLSWRTSSVNTPIKYVTLTEQEAVNVTVIVSGHEVTKNAYSVNAIRYIGFHTSALLEHFLFILTQ